MARQFLTGLNLNKNELSNAKIQNLTTSEISAIGSPTAGQLAFDTDLHQLKVYSGSAWLALAAGGNVEEAINAAIDLITTTVIEEGTNLYYTTARAKEDAADLLTSATKTNITITGDGSGLTITAENGVADSTTDDLDEGTTNLYFTDQRAIDAVGGSATSANTPNTVVKRDGSGNFAAGTISANGYNVQDAGSIFEDSGLIIQSNSTYPILIQGNQDVTIESTSGDIILDADGDVYKGGSATAGNELITQNRLDQYIGDNTVNGSTGNTVADRITSVATDISTHINDTSAHGTTGDVVGTSDSQTLTNKTLGTGTVLSANIDANTYTITDLGTPSADSDAATKLYVDDTVLDHAAATSGIHGLTGSLVGTSDSQTLTNKNLGTGTALTADLDADGQKITNLDTPTAPGDAANKAYVDNAVAGLTWKAGVHLLADSNVALTGSTGLVIDSHAALDTNDDGYRILLTAQSTDSQNGIYVYNDDGTNYTLTRATDADVYTELIHATVFIQEGTVYGQSAWTQSNGYLTDFTSQDWVQFSGAAQITAGAGLTKTGNTLDVVGTSGRITANADSIDIASTYVGQSSITTLGTITTGVWNGTDIAVADGGTGASTAAGARANLGATTKYTEANPELTVSSGEVTWTVTHGLGIRTVVVQVYDTVGFDSVEVDVERTNTNTVTLQWPASATVDAGAYQVVIVG